MVKPSVLEDSGVEALWDPETSLSVDKLRDTMPCMHNIVLGKSVMIADLLPSNNFSGNIVEKPEEKSIFKN